jgi:preprotein translocase subunit YajC
MFAALITLLATAPKEAPTGPTADPLLNFLPILILMVLGYFLLIRSPMKRQEAERKTMLASLKKGDKVLTQSGIYGTIVNVAENEDEITVKVDDNVRLRMTKGSIARNIRMEEEAKAAKEKPKEGAA